MRRSRYIIRKYKNAAKNTTESLQPAAPIHTEPLLPAPDVTANDNRPVRPAA